MTERIDPPYSGDPFDELAPELNALSARYARELRPAAPGEHVDAAILAAARRAVNAGPLSAKNVARPGGARPSWHVPLALAATVALCGTIALGVWHEERDALVSRDSPPTFSAKADAVQSAPAPAASALVAPTGTAAPPTPANAVTRQSPAGLPALSAHSETRQDRVGSKKTPSLEAAQLATARPAEGLPADKEDSKQAQFAEGYGQNSTARPEASSPPRLALASPAAPQPQSPQAFNAPAMPAASAPAPLPQEPVAAPAPPLPRAKAESAAAASPSAQVQALARRAPMMAATVDTVVPDSAEGRLLVALEGAIERGDQAAAKAMLETLHRDYPNTTLSPSVMERLRQLGLDPTE